MPAGKNRVLKILIEVSEIAEMNEREQVQGIKPDEIIEYRLPSREEVRRQSVALVSRLEREGAIDGNVAREWKDNIEQDN